MTHTHTQNDPYAGWTEDERTAAVALLDQETAGHFNPTEV